MTQISLKTVAETLHRLRMDGGDVSERELAKPRLVEGMCFVAAMTQLPGGADRFCADFLKQSPAWLQGLPCRMAWDYNLRKLRDHYASEQDNAASLKALEECEAEGRDNSLENGELSRLLVSWCAGEEFGGPFEWCTFAERCPGFLDALGIYMDAYAQSAIAKTADTSLRRRAFKELDFARRERVPVPLVSDTRHGKTTAAETYCNAFPGRCRLVTVPASNGERDFLRAHAAALGLDYTPKTPTSHLKEWAVFTLQNTGLFLLYDESHFLIPLNYGSDTPARRLEWIRTEVVDRHVPCAFLATPQSNNDTLKRYADKTQACLEQWLGRIAQPVVLSDEPTDEDYLAVARVNFKDFSGNVLAELCDVAAQKQGGFKWLEQVGRRARFEAQERVALAGVRQAVGFEAEAACDSALVRVTLDDVRIAAEWAGAGLPINTEQAGASVPQKAERTGAGLPADSMLAGTAKRSARDLSGDELNPRGRCVVPAKGLPGMRGGRAVSQAVTQ